MQTPRIHRVSFVALLAISLAPLVACQVVGDIDEKKAAEPAEAATPTEPATPAEAPVAACGEEGGSCAAPPPKQSCNGAIGAKKDCGGTNGKTDCCESRAIVGGKFFRNYDGQKDGFIPHDDKSYPATVSDFSLDTFEVTVGRFRAFVDAGMGTQAKAPAAGSGAHPKIKATGWDALWSSRLEADTAALASALECGTLNDEPVTWTKKAGDNERRPLLCASWYEAFAFCAWDGGRLPTNTELNYAASGGSEQRLYPWGNAPYTDAHGFQCHGDCKASDFAVVGSHPLGKGKWGHLDLAGSVSEWVFDSAVFPGPSGIDPADTKDTLSRYTRGGGYISIPQLEMIAAAEKQRFAVDRIGIGFRCARDP